MADKTKAREWYQRGADKGSDEAKSWLETLDARDATAEHSVPAGGACPPAGRGGTARCYDAAAAGACPPLVMGEDAGSAR